MKNLLLVFLVLFLGFGALKGSEMKNIQSLSLIDVIANADKYNGEKVRLIGFLSLGFESKAVYLSSLDYKHSITKNALWVDVDKSGEYKKFDKQYVLIEGVFDAKNKGHLKLYSGEIKDVTRIILWGDKEK